MAPDNAAPSARQWRSLAATWLAPAAAIIAVLAALGLILLIAVDSLVSLPRVAVEFRSAEAHGELGAIGSKDIAFDVELNYFSECMALSVAGAPDHAEPGFSIRSPAVLWTPDTDPCPAAAEATRDAGSHPWFDYSRYWHGYRVLYFPLMEALGFRGTQGVMAMLLIGAISALFLALLRHFTWQGIFLGYTTVLLSGLPLAYALPTHAISLAVLFLATTAWLVWQNGKSGRTLLMGALVCGAAYNYVDFFYNPEALAILVGGLRALGRLRRAPPTRALAWEAGLAAAFVLAGYLGMWLAKWIIGGGFALISGAASPILPGDFTRWVAGGDSVYVPLAATASLVVAATNNAVRLVVLILAALLSLHALRRRGWVAARGFAVLAAPMLVGIIAIETASGHSLAHKAFVDRIVPISEVLAMLLACQMLWDPAPQEARRSHGSKSTG